MIIPLSQIEQPRYRAAEFEWLREHRFTAEEYNRLRFFRYLYETGKLHD